MLPGLSYFFSAKFLAHRQVSRWTNPGQFCQPFFKFSSYRSAKMCSYCIDVLFKEILLKRKEKKEKQRKKVKKKKMDNKRKKGRRNDILKQINNKEKNPWWLGATTSF